MDSHSQAVGINGELTVVSYERVAVDTVILIGLYAHVAPVWYDIYR